jgi:hypothetical protein
VPAVRRRRSARFAGVSSPGLRRAALALKRENPALYTPRQVLKASTRREEPCPCRP